MGCGASVHSYPEDLERSDSWSTAQQRAVHGRGKFSDSYVLGEKLGQGKFGEVLLAKRKGTDQEFAVKIMNFPTSNTLRAEIERQDIQKEVEMLIELSHPRIVSLVEYFEDPKNHKVYLVTELLRGGQLKDVVKKVGRYPEEDARTVFQQLLEGVEYLHSNAVVHRDLKLENIVLMHLDDRTSVKIADFGFAKSEKPGEKELHGACGTPHYLAPEVIESLRPPTKKEVRLKISIRPTFSFEVDMWALGVILHYLLAGYYPFNHRSVPKLFEQICRCEYDFEDDAWCDVSREAKDLVSRLLMKDRTKRITVHEALMHPWTTNNMAWLPPRTPRQPKGSLTPSRSLSGDHGIAFVRALLEEGDGGREWVGTGAGAGAGTGSALIAHNISNPREPVQQQVNSMWSLHSFSTGSDRTFEQLGGDHQGDGQVV